MKHSLLISIALVGAVATTAVYAQSADAALYDKATSSSVAILPMLSGSTNFRVATPTAMPSPTYARSAPELRHTGHIMVSSTTLPLGLAVAQRKTSESGMFA